MFKPTYGQFAEAYHDQARRSCRRCAASLAHFASPPCPISPQAVFLNVTGDANKSTAALMKRLNVKSVPAFFLYRAGAQVGTFTGANKTAFRAQLKAHINLFD